MAGEIASYFVKDREHGSAYALKLDRLAPITSTFFSIDRESQVEFLRDGTGVVSSIRIYWNDGWVDTIARSE